MTIELDDIDKDFLARSHTQDEWRREHKDALERNALYFRRVLQLMDEVAALKAEVNRLRGQRDSAAVMPADAIEADRLMTAAMRRQPRSGPDNDQAYPTFSIAELDADRKREKLERLRDEIAMAALNGLLAKYGLGEVAVMVTDSYEFADCAIAAREAKP